MNSKFKKWLIGRRWLWIKSKGYSSFGSPWIMYSHVLFFGMDKFFYLSRQKALPFKMWIHEFTETPKEDDGLE